jgi:uncharacterized protein
MNSMQIKHGCVSADNHLRVPYLPGNLWQDRVPAKFKEIAPKVVQASDGRRQWTVEGRAWGFQGSLPGAANPYTVAGVEEEPEPGVFRASTPKYRLEDMDRDGVDAEIINGPFETLSTIRDNDLRIACIEAVNNWAKDFYQESEGRLILLYVLPSSGPDEAIRELHRVAKLGLPTGAIFDWANAPEPVWHSMWEPVWAAAAETGLPINLHVGGGGTPQGGFPRGEKGWEGGVLGGPSGGDYNRNVRMIHAGAFSLPLGEITTALVMSGILDRNPKARFVIEETGVGLIVHLMYRLDREYEGPRPRDFELSMRPSELLRRQLYFTFQEEEEEGLKRIPELADRIMWASDYPGADSTWPHSRGRVIELLDRSVGEEMRRKVTFDNVVQLYNLAPVLVG